METKPKTDLLKIVIVVLLALILAVQVWNIVGRITLQAKITSVTESFEIQRTTLYDDFINATYNTKSVDNINKQLLMANQFQLNYLSTLIEQNNAMLNVLAALR